MAENVLEKIMIGLVNAGIKKVSVNYDGGGDSGAIESITYSTDPNIEFDDLQGWNSDANSLNDYNSELYSLLEDYCQEMLLNDIEDWWNNDGGFGYVNIDVEEGTYEIQNSIRVTDYEEFNHYGNLFEKNKR
jgi:hypothetical protein